MRRIARAVGLLLVVIAAGLAAPSASFASCGLLGLFPCPPPQDPPAPSTPINEDGSLRVNSNPYALEPLPPVEPGGPLYPRDYGHLYFGLTDNAGDEGSVTYDQVAAVVASIGGSFVRLGLWWPSAEYSRDHYTWSRYDGEYRALVAHGLRPYWTIFSTPRWAAPPGATCAGHQSNYCSSEPTTHDGLLELERFGEHLATRYPLAAGFEYRNEPNLDANGKCTDDPSWSVPPDEYTDSLIAFARGVHAARPAMRVLGGDLSSCHWGDRAPRYLDAMLTNGAATEMDGISWHPGDVSDDFHRFRDAINEVAAVLRAHDVADMRIVASEVGYAAKEDRQSERLKTEYMLINAQDSSLDLVGNYDAFTGFTDVATNDQNIRPYGWVGRKDWFNKYPPHEVFCDFRDLLGLARPLPSFMHNCSLMGSSDLN
jgi:hypothetical protein